MNSKQRKILELIFQEPVNPSIKWSDIENLLNGLGADMSEGRGSRLRVALNGVRAVFHRPHPQRTTDKGAIKSARRFLITAGVKQ